MINVHQAVLDFLTEVKAKVPENFISVKVFELGSLDVNGTPRRFFENCDYIGVDWRPGPCVDIVKFVHELDFPNEAFDTIISTEMLEHDRWAKLSFVNALRMLKKPGLFVFTCANEKRAPHEIEAGFRGHYQGISKIQILTWILISREFSAFYLEEVGEDLRGWIKK